MPNESNSRPTTTPISEVTRRDHRYGPYVHFFDKLCDGGCSRPVPYTLTDNDLRRIGWDVTEDDSYGDGKCRICPACLDDDLPVAVASPKPTD